MIAIETILGMAAVILFSVFIARKRASEGDGDDGGASGDVDDAGAIDCAGSDWCEAIESASGIPAFCLDDFMRLASLGPRASKLMRKTPGIRGVRPHLFDIVPEGASRTMLEGAALARRGVSSSRRVAWERMDVGASFAPFTNGGVMVLIREMEEV